MPIIKDKTQKTAGKQSTEEVLSKVATIIEAFKGEQGDRGKDGKDATPEEVVRILKSDTMFKDSITGETGRNGKDGRDGMDGKDGKDGLDGRDGRDGKDGRDGADGKDGSPDEPEEIIRKIRKAKGINVEDVRGLEEALSRRIPSQMIGAPRIPVLTNGIGNPTPLGSLNVVTGTSGATFTNNPGTQDYTLNLSGLTPGGGGGLTELPATGTVNGTNKSFTFTSLPQYIVSDNAWYRQTNSKGETNWTWNSGTLTATMTVAPQSDIFGEAAGGVSELTATGSVNGTNASFTFTSKPKYVVSDGAWYKETNRIGETVWSWNGGTSTATMTVPPQSDIFGISS